jgi:ABC-2 type transport system permease protein
MLTEFSHILRRNRVQILAWGFGLAVLGGYLLNFSETFIGTEQQATLKQLFEIYPEELMAFFGDMDQMFTPSGFLHIEFFSYMPIILGIYAILAGSGLLVGDEENGIMDLVMSYPISRIALYWGRMLAFLLSTVLILFIVWVGFALVIPSTELGISPWKMALPILSLLSVLVLFGTVSVVLSMLLPSRRMTALISGVLMVASFFITGLSSIDERLETIARFSPLNYYQGGEALDQVNWEWILGLLGFSVLFILLGWLGFWRRDIRVGGEGGWSLPKITRRDSREAV